MTLLTINKIPQRLSQLDIILQNPADVRCRYRTELNAIDNTVTDAKHSAESKCRKLHCGHIQWCPRVTKAINTILFWKSIQKRDSGGKVGLSILRTRAKKANLEHVPYPGEYSTAETKSFITKAYHQLKRLKQDENRRNTWLSQLIDAQAKVWDRSKKHYGSNFGLRNAFVEQPTA